MQLRTPQIDSTKYDAFPECKPRLPQHMHEVRAAQNVRTIRRQRDEFVLCKFAHKAGQATNLSCAHLGGELHEFVGPHQDIHALMEKVKCKNIACRSNPVG
eukprot:604101-Amphidinium_carterae.1